MGPRKVLGPRDHVHRPMLPGLVILSEGSVPVRTPQGLSGVGLVAEEKRKGGILRYFLETRAALLRAIPWIAHIGINGGVS